MRASFQSNPDTAPKRYDGVTVALHWISAGLIALLWVIGQTRFFWPAGQPRSAVLSVHILFGLTLLVMLLARVAWRATSGRHLPAIGHRLSALGARLAHLALYGLIGLTLLAGLSGVMARGLHLFGLALLPPLTLLPAGLMKTFGHLHGNFANILVALAVLHGLAALFHRMVLRDGTLERMLPGR
ncbi:MAG TPA: cytochrome b/b6 domain-containing protein [Acetobacteraceae bacterium]|nr:cytochrome b/b6 domain-containing protein [Acetobacteraceae bacterium]